ncbi:hypothetical protein PROFUN_01042 [Planoprotostelium fungivorum]|uniref:Uncharacterized protein n=1 Tax=Planoprotostelium fungivorum TaxID=1890364 RepID=A0A2P6N4I4_9EUKA|nr:hypothetical protein PROFUN_01042 [Planoprotostelium fungivorum]
MKENWLGDSMTAEDASFRDNIVNKALKASENGTIIFVQEAKAWEDVNDDIVKRFDPRGIRSFTVYTNFHLLLNTVTSARELQNYFSGKPASQKAFWVSTFSSATKRAVEGDRDKFKARIEQSQQRDADIMRKHKIDPRYEPGFGAQAFRRHLIEVVGKRYQEALPELQKQLRVTKTNHTDMLEYVRNQARTLDLSKLRVQATSYVSDFCRYQVALLLGTVESVERQLSSFGQTLEEEKIETADWMDHDGRNMYQLMGVSAEDLPNWNTRLSGGNQLERLLAEFKMITDRIIMEDTVEDELVNAISLSGPQMVCNRIWAASDIVQQKCRMLLGPLVDQLIARAIYIVKRQIHAVQRIMETKKGHRTGIYASATDQNTYDTYIKDCRKFVWFVHDSFEQVVDDTAAIIRQKCAEELQCTKMVCWMDPSSINEYERQTARHSASLNMQKNLASDSVERLASDSFQKQQQRITRNCSLKIYDGFLSRMQVSLSAALQGKIAILTEAEIADMFDLDIAKQTLYKEQKRLEELVERDPEPSFKEATMSFRPWF